jgi:hypothetical protein
MNATRSELLAEASQRSLTMQTLLDEDSISRFGLLDDQDKAYERFRSEGASEAEALYLRNLRALFVTAAKVHYRILDTSRERLDEELLHCARNNRSPEDVLAKRLGLKTDLSAVPLESLRKIVETDKKRAPPATLAVHRDAALRIAVENVAAWIRADKPRDPLRARALRSAWLAAHLAEKDEEIGSPVLELMSLADSESQPWELAEWSHDFDLAADSHDTADAQTRDGAVSAAAVIVAWLADLSPTTVREVYRGAERSNEPWIGHISMRSGRQPSRPK